MGERRWLRVTNGGSIRTLTDAEVLAEMGARRTDAVRTNVKGFGWCWVIPDPLGPRPDGLRGQVWIVEEAEDG